VNDKLAPNLGLAINMHEARTALSSSDHRQSQQKTCGFPLVCRLLSRLQPLAFPYLCSWLCPRRPRRSCHRCSTTPRVRTRCPPSGARGERRREQRATHGGVAAQAALPRLLCRCKSFFVFIIVSVLEALFVVSQSHFSSASLVTYGT
jgi:hypothetical protein